MNKQYCGKKYDGWNICGNREMGSDDPMQCDDCHKASEYKMTDDDILYCLQNLAGYEPSDIEDDTVEIAVNDDQFAEMSIVRTAQLGAELIEKLIAQNKMLIEAQPWLKVDSLYKGAPVRHSINTALDAQK